MLCFDSSNFGIFAQPPVIVDDLPDPNEDDTDLFTLASRDFIGPKARSRTMATASTFGQEISIFRTG